MVANKGAEPEPQDRRARDRAEELERQKAVERAIAKANGAKA